MPRIKVATAVLNQTPMAWENNTRNIIDAIEEARRQQVSLLCLPELCITGYGCEDYFFAYDLEEQAKKCLDVYKRQSMCCMGSKGEKAGALEEILAPSRHCGLKA